MINPFERFYDTEVGVYEREGGGYSERAKETLLDTLVCDLQPYTADTENKMYGLSTKKAYTIYCDKNDLLKNGRYILFGGEWYMIVSVNERRFGTSELIRSV